MRRPILRGILTPPSRASLSSRNGGPARWIAAPALALALVAPAPAGADTTLQPVGTYAEPLHVTSDPDDHERLLVAERAGTIQLTTPEGTSEYVDLSSVVRSSGGEQGLLSVAFPPDHADSGLLYVAYTRETDGALNVAELEADGDLADPESLRTVLTVPSPFSNHNAGQLQFGTDGYLYVSTGDGGSGGDPQGHGQNPSTLLGNVLRIDPRQSGAEPYTIPESNPYVDPETHPVPETRAEVWSWGLRNPWRFGFDRETGALVIGDVGQGAREEIDYRPQEVGGGSGDNFGWNCREGFIAYGSPSPDCDDTGPDFTDPVFDYPNTGFLGDCAIVGGYVVRDPSLADLEGRYVYADSCGGELRSIELDLPAASDDREEGLSVPSPSSFGEDACGRIYVASLAGTVSRLVDDVEPECDEPSEDEVPPETTVQLNGAAPEPTYDGPVDVALSATDGEDENATGVDYTEYRIDSDHPEDWVESPNTGGDDPFETAFTVEGEGSHVVEYRSVDNAGNEEEPGSVGFEIAGDDGEADLKVTGAPKRRTVGKRHKQAVFRIRAKNRGDADTGTVRLCALGPPKRLKVMGPRCVVRNDIAPGKRKLRRVKVRIKPAARGTTSPIRLIGKGPNVDKERAVVRLRVRR